MSCGGWLKGVWRLCAGIGPGQGMGLCIGMGHGSKRRQLRQNFGHLQ